MPSLGDAYPEIRDLLGIATSSTRTNTAPRPDENLAPLAAIVRAWLHRELDALRADAAFAAFRDADLVAPASLVEAHPSEIVETLRSVGARLPPKSIATLQKIAQWAKDRGEDSLPDAATEALRDEWLGINGIGPGTADALLLHALDRPVYPVDRPSYRIFARHGWIDSNAEYDEARDVFERLEPENPEALRALAQSLDTIGRDFCRATRPRCERCPLRPFLPEHGPVEG